MPTLKCPHCGAAQVVPQDMLGEDVDCPACKVDFRAELDDEPVTRPSRNRRASRPRRLHSESQRAILLSVGTGVVIAVFLCVFLFSWFGANKVTKAKYDAVREGMSYSEVARIIGSAGEENASASSKIEGFPGVMPTISIKMYTWQNADGSNMVAMFQNDKLTTKAQIGLK